MTPMPITVACLDMAGTTVADDGSVIAAFSAAVEQFGLPEGTQGYDEALAYVRQTMGQSKIEVFRHILGAEDAAQQANASFEEHYARSVRAGDVAPLPGATETFAALRAAGIKVCLATGFSPATRDALLDALGWRTLVDLVLSPADAGRGRPWPDLPLTALLRLGGGAVGELAVAGDTPSDVESGLRAGAGLVAGVLTGSSTREELEQAKAPVILDTIADLLPLVGAGGCHGHGPGRGFSAGVQHVRERGQHVRDRAVGGDLRVAQGERDADAVDERDREHGDLLGAQPGREPARLGALPDHVGDQPPPGAVVAQRVGPHLGVPDAEVPGLDPQAAGPGRTRLIAAQRAGDDVAELPPRVVKPGEVGLQRRDLGARRVPERRDQQVLAGAEVILQGADRHAALRGHVREPGGVGAPLGDHPAGRLEHRHLAPPGPPLAAAAGRVRRPPARPARGACAA